MLQGARILALNFLSSDPNTLVTFLIGTNETPFQIHKEFVNRNSQVLKKAFESGFVEGQTQTYRLEDVSVGAFRFFVEWIYTKQLEVLQLKDQKYQNGGDEADERSTVPHWEVEEDKDLVQLWVLADKFALPQLQNNVISTFIDLKPSGNLCSALTFKYIYDNTAIDSPLRKLIISQAARYSKLLLKHCPRDKVPMEMWADIVSYMNRECGCLSGAAMDAENFFVLTGDEDENNSPST